MEYSAVSTIWVLLGAAMVFFMQAGFAMVETGFTRAKNAGNIIMKNLMDLCIGTPLFWLVGFGIMFGTGSFIGSYSGIANPVNYAAVSPEGVPFWAYFIFQTVFCATSATIVSGAMAERTKFSSYCLYSAVISLIVYPVEAHWIWGGGFLSELGFHDFAGSTAVHMCGGVAALIGAAILGPRIGKDGKDGKPRAIPGHSLTLGALGCFILWFCWFGFNGCSTVGMGSDEIMEIAGKVFVNTNLAAAVATTTTMLYTWIRYKKPDVSMTLNGSLAGLVGITAGCDCVSPVGAVVIGIISGIAVVVGIELVDQKLKIDDPVGAVGVHGVNGMLGTILLGFLSDGSDGVGKGLIYGGSASFLGVQVLGVLCVISWTAVTMTIVFQVIKHTVGLRASREEEILGMDATEHNLPSAYADFMPAPEAVPTQAAQKILANQNDKLVSAEAAVPVEKAVPVQVVRGKTAAPASDVKLTKVTIICKQNRFEELKEALNKIGVMGITMSQVLGCGVQKGNTRYYRGVAVDMVLLPKLQVDVVVSKVPVREVIEAAKTALYTGNIGDGKIFVYDVENVIKVRTGEEGFDALQGEEDDLA